MTDEESLLLGASPALTCLITSGGLSGGSDVTAHDDLDLGLDLGALAWDLCDIIPPHSGHTLEDSFDTATAIGTLDRSSNDQADLRALDALDFLDFDVASDVLLALNQIDSLITTTTTTPTTTMGQDWASSATASASFYNEATASPAGDSLINSPSAEQTMSLAADDDQDDDQYDDQTCSSSSAESPAPRKGSSVGRVIDKRQSNKAAAVKYRTKKLKERELLFAECELYERRNVELKKKIDDTQSEISFIKSLLVEALIAKNAKK